MKKFVQRVIIPALVDIWLYRNYPGMSVWHHRKQHLLNKTGLAPKRKTLPFAYQAKPEKGKR